MTNESLRNIINQKDDMWIEREYLGDGIFKCISNGKEFSWEKMDGTIVNEPATYLIIPRKAGILDMGGEFHIVTNPQHRRKGLAERLINKWIDYRRPEICGADKDGYIPHTSCTTGGDGCDEQSQTIIEYLLTKCGFKFTDSKYQKPHGGWSGDENKKWRYFYV